MGEYIKNLVTGEEMKIGVLDHCFYSRQQIEKWHYDKNWVGWYADKEEEGTLEYYLNNSNSLYGKIEGLVHNDFAIKLILDEPAAIEHKRVYVLKKGKRGSGYQYKVDCQFVGQKEIWAQIIGERCNKEGKARTIFACDCCEVWFSLLQEVLDKSLQNMQKELREYLAPILKGIT